MAVYLDSNATTSVDPQVIDEMLPYLETNFGNPSSIHSFGQQARRGLDQARERVANFIGCEPEEIIFTSGGTESDNQAIVGTLAIADCAGQHVVTTKIEHQAVLETCAAMERRGASITYANVDKHGIVNIDSLFESVTDSTVLISVMAVNNDLGTIQPLETIIAQARNRGIKVHTDAVQAVGKIPFNVTQLGADLATISSHKIHGPKGAGALYVKRGTRISRLLHGGHHERKRRAGTQNVPGIVGFGKACELAGQRMVEDSRTIAALRDNLEQGILKRVPNSSLNGHPNLRISGTTNINFANIDAEAMLIALDIQGIAASAGSACSAGNHEPSHVLTAMGYSALEARSSIRFSVGRQNTAEEIDQVITVVEDLVKRLRLVSSME